MSATLSSTEQKVYNKVMASKRKAMTLAQIEAAIPGLSKKEMNSSINNILRLKLFTAAKGKDEVLVFHAVAVEDAKRQNTLTEEQQYVLSIIDKAGNKGISRPAIANQVSTELLTRPLVFKALEALEKSQLIKTFKSVNAPTMPLYILAHLKPPEDIAGGIWFDESKEYDSVFVDSLRMVVFKYVQHKTFPVPKNKDAISALCPNPINPVSKTPALPTPQELLSHIMKNRVTTAKLTVKNVMEICRALELDGLIEAIKPLGGVSVEPAFESESEDDEPVTKRHKSAYDDLDPKERDRRERKDKEKAKAKIKERKREQRRREREKERERKRKEKDKERKRKEKEREKERKRKEKDKERKRKEKEKRKKRVIDSDDDASDDELRAIDDVKKSKSKRKRRAADSDSDSGSGSDSDTSSSSSSSDSSSDSDSDSDSDVSSVMSDDLAEGNGEYRPAGTMGISSNPFFAADGRQTLIDLSDQAVVYRATRRLVIPLGQNQISCGSCPQFNFCEPDGPVNPSGCQYITDWLAGTNGGWTADVKAEKAKKAAEEEKERRRAAAEAAGEVFEEAGEANGDMEVEFEHDELEHDEKEDSTW